MNKPSFLGRVAASVLLAASLSTQAFAAGLGSYTGGLGELIQKNDASNSETTRTLEELTTTSVDGSDSTGQLAGAPNALNPAKESCLAMGNNWNQETQTCSVNYAQLCSDIGGEFKNGTCNAVAGVTPPAGVMAVGWYPAAMSGSNVPSTVANDARGAIAWGTDKTTGYYSKAITVEGLRINLYANTWRAGNCSNGMHNRFSIAWGSKNRGEVILPGSKVIPIWNKTIDGVKMPPKAHSTSCTGHPWVGNFLRAQSGAWIQEFGKWLKRHYIPTRSESQLAGIMNGYAKVPFSLSSEGDIVETDGISGQFGYSCPQVYLTGDASKIYSYLNPTIGWNGNSNPRKNIAARVDAAAYKAAGVTAYALYDARASLSTSQWSDDGGGGCASIYKSVNARYIGTLILPN